MMQEGTGWQDGALLLENHARGSTFFLPAHWLCSKINHDT